MYLPLTPLILCYLLLLSLRIFKVKAKQYFTPCLADQLLKTAVFFYLCLKQKAKRKRPGKIWCVQCIGSILMSQCFRVSCHICYMSLGNTSFSHMYWQSLSWERITRFSFIAHFSHGLAKDADQEKLSHKGKFRMPLNPIHFDLCCARISVYINENNLHFYSSKYGKCWT